MRNILITGKNSYIGRNLKKMLGYYPNRYSVDSISLRDESWKNNDLSKYDVVIHVAAIVHQKEKPDMESLYLKVNRDLPLEVAKKAKISGVKQFIFTSTMAVYGEVGEIGQEVVITKNTIPNPKTFYGRTKLEAECELQKLSSETFKILILRLPMVYGPNCPGNYRKLESLALKTPIFPMIKNKRSMLHINKLCLQIKDYIDKEKDGIYLPQDDQYINTSILVKSIAEQNGRKIFLSKSLGILIRIIGKKSNIIRKIFGNLVYQYDKEFD
jgi:UDP-glucose 4-epimerase